MGHVRDQLADRQVITPGAVSVALLVSALACWLAIGGGQASAAPVSCGDTITADTTLHQNLVNCPNNGIVIGANGVTLNLNGHLVDGDGTPASGCDSETEFCDVGVVNDGHDGVTVKQGSVREFLYGVFVGRARHNRVLGISSSKNLFFGFVVAESARSLVRRSSGSNNVAPEGDGMILFRSHHIRIRRNAFRRNPGPGIHVVDSTHNLIKRNRLSRNGPGILMEADHNRVRRNRLTRGAGILVGPGSRNVIARNRVSRAVDSLAIEKGRGNLVARNIVVRARGAGIRLGLRHPFIGGAHNVVRRNRVKRSGDDGFLVKKDHRSLLKRNVALGAGDDGFDVESRSTKLRGNRAARNGDLGIEAVPGVIDRGGNRARGNGDPRQCTNVACD
jgi:parallel beta-helix repeat protein